VLARVDPRDCLRPDDRVVYVETHGDVERRGRPVIPESRAQDDRGDDGDRELGGPVLRDAARVGGDLGDECDRPFLRRGRDVQFEGRTGDGGRCRGRRERQPSRRIGPGDVVLDRVVRGAGRSTDDGEVVGRRPPEGRGGGTLDRG